MTSDLRLARVYVSFINNRRSIESLMDELNSRIKFYKYQKETSICTTVLMDNLLSNGWSDYDFYVSDHRPVMISIDTNQ